MLLNIKKAEKFVKFHQRNKNVIVFEKKSLIIFKKNIDSKLNYECECVIKNNYKLIKN